MPNPRLIKVIDGMPSAMCVNGLSPAVECLNNPRACPCGYAEGLSKPHYPVPAIKCQVSFVPSWDIDSPNDGYVLIEEITNINPQSGNWKATKDDRCMVYPC